MMNSDNYKSQAESKEKIIDLLEFPQLLLLTEIRERNCIHDAEFCLKDKECWGCDLGEECLGLIGRFGGFTSADNLKTIIRKMQIAHDYVLSKAAHSKQESRTCFCDSCSWLRDIKQALREVDGLSDE